MMFVDTHPSKDKNSTKSQTTPMHVKGFAKEAGSECDLSEGLWEDQADLFGGGDKAAVCPVVILQD